MKKLLLLCVSVFAFGALMRAQNPTGPINDTLRYFEYKYIYKQPLTTSLTVHPFYKGRSATLTNTLITHVGSIFRNTDTNLIVYGLETRLYRPQKVFSVTSAGVPFRLYLCNVVNNLPVFPPIDSVSGGINSTPGDMIVAPDYKASRIGAYFGAKFGNAVPTPRRVKGDFAVLGRCTSTQAGDTVVFLHTGGYTPTASITPPSKKFGEGLGVVRKGGVFSSTRNFNDPAFGVGTDYEFCFSPMVTFSLQVSQKESTTLQGACQWQPFTNTNTSSPEFTNRQFNFNQFFRQLRNFDPQAPIVTAFIADSVFAWDVGDGQPPFYLKVNLDSIELYYGAGICNQFFNGTQTGKYKQAAYNINAATITSVLNFTGSCVWCNGDTALSGIREMGPLAKAKIYPNPTFDKAMITGLEGSNTINIYNMMGQLISSETIKEETLLLDFSKQPQGTYLIRMTNSANNKRLFKVLRQ